MLKIFFKSEHKVISPLAIVRPAAAAAKLPSRFNSVQPHRLETAGLPHPGFEKNTAGLRLPMHGSEKERNNLASGPLRPHDCSLPGPHSTGIFQCKSTYKSIAFSSSQTTRTQNFSTEPKNHFFLLKSFLIF